MAKHSHTSKLLRSTLVISLGTLASRALGLLRDIAMAYAFGICAAMDAFFIASMIPNLFRKLFGEGALSAALIPALSRYKETRGHDAARALVAAVFARAALILVLLVLVSVAIVLFGSPQWFGIESSESWASFQLYFIILAPLVFFLCLGGLQAGVLNAYDSFALPSLVPALHNVIWIGGIVVAIFLVEGIERQIEVMCIAILIGGIVQWALQAHGLWRKGFMPRDVFVMRDPGSKGVWRDFFPTMLALGVFQINTLLDQIIAQSVGDGAVSSFNYANRLFQFPLGLVGVALATAIFPMLARYAAREETTKFTGGLLSGIRMLAFIVIPATAGLIVLHRPIMISLMVSGQFTLEDAERSALVLLCTAFALPFVCALQVVTKAFYALKDVKTPTRLALISVVINLGVNLIMVRTELREAGLAVGTALSTLFNLVMLSVILRRRLRGTIIESGRQPLVLSERLARPYSPSDLRRLKLSLVRTTCCGAIMAGVLWGMLEVLPPFTQRGVGELVALAACLAVGMGVYLAAHALLGSAEFEELRNAARRKKSDRDPA